MEFSTHWIQRKNKIILLKHMKLVEKDLEVSKYAFL